MSEGIFITDNEGMLIEVTDFTDAYNEAKNHCINHELCYKKRHSKGVHYFFNAHKRWQRILSELDKIKIKHPSIYKKKLN